MKKREFLKSLALGAIGVGASRLSLAAVTPEQSRRPPKNWIRIKPGRPGQPRKADEWRRLFQSLQASHVDAAIIEVYDGRHAYWESDRLPVMADALGTAITAGLHLSVEVHAAMRTLPCLVPDVLQKHRDWYDVNAKGESTADKPPYADDYRFLDPARPEVREWLKGIVGEICDHPRLTGIVLDDLHYPPALLPKALAAKYKVAQDRVYPQFDYGYSELNRKAYKKAHGVDPIAIKDPAADKAWTQYRVDALTELVNGHLVPAARTRGRLISSTVLPGPTLARKMAYQDWGHWPLDSFLPTLHNADYETGPDWVKQQTAEAVAAVQVPVYAGLSSESSDATTLATLVRSAREGGADGIVLDSLDAMTDEKWKAFQDALQPKP
jgi:hypothetical protein